LYHRVNCVNKYRKNCHKILPISLISFSFRWFRFISFSFRWFRFVSFLLISFRFVSFSLTIEQEYYAFIQRESSCPFHLVASFKFWNHKSNVSFVSFLLISFRFCWFRFVSFRFVFVDFISFRFYCVSHFIGTYFALKLLSN
jgi:hypothetical protein